MEIRSFSAEVLARLPLPVVAVTAVGGGRSSEGDLCVVWANPAARAVFGEGIEGSWVARDQPFGMLGPVARVVELALDSGELNVVEGPVEHDGAVLHRRCTVLPVGSRAALMFEDGPVGAEGRSDLTMLDRTVRRAQRWGNLGVWELDLVDGDLYWSTQVFEILGVEELSLERFYAVVHPGDRELVDHVTQRVVEQPGPYRVTHRIMRDGEVRTLEQHMQSVPDTTGRPVRLLGTVIDVTEARALQQQMHHGQQMRTIGRLAGGVAHDLANALLIMRGHAEVLLARADLDDDARSGLAAIARGGERASTLTRRFMALGRREELRPGRIDPEALVEDVCDLVGPAIQPGLELTVEGSEHLGAIQLLADPDRLRQVLLDLVFNARDAGATSVVLRLDEMTVHPQDPRSVDGGLAPGHYGVIHVEDNGAGMAPDVVEQIFEPFFTTKASDTGSGIGLANAWDFAHQSLGTILVESTPGVGTTMSVLIPAATATGTAPRVRGRRPPRRVLVGSASAARCNQVAEILTAQGLQVACASSIAGIGYSVRTEPIDVVVVDESLVPPSAWPEELSNVATVVLTTRPGQYPRAAVEVDDVDHRGLLNALDELFVPSGT